MRADSTRSARAPIVTEADDSNTYFNGNKEDIGAGSGGKDRARERALYARQIQRASTLALQRVRQNSLLASSGWAEPLTAAPTAISVMAFLMKTAADKKVAGLKVPSLDIKDITQTKVVGKLPSVYFHTDLMHCSDVGRLAFLDAQKRMNKINSTANSIMADGGPITYLIEVLEDPEDAKLNLKRTLDELKTKAAGSGAEVAEIQKQFDYWHLVINHLGIQAKDLYTHTVGEQQKVGESKVEAERETKKYDDQRANAINQIKDLEAQLDIVSNRVSRAQDMVDNIASLPPLPESTYFQDLREAQELNPSTPASEIERGLFKRGYKWVFGPTDAMRSADQMHQDAHHAREEAAQQKIIAQEKLRRENLKRDAERRLQQAKDDEARLYTEYDIVAKQLSDSRGRLTEAKTSLAKASSDLERLGNRELELDDIIGILQKSTKELAKLKGQLGRLVTFFSTLETSIAENAVDDVKTFLDLIQDNSKIEGNQIINLQLRGASKKRVLATALQIQGQFSTISDISSAYVKISDNYIRPAINQMEELATTDDNEFKDASRKFSKWCDQAVTDIDGVFKETHSKMDANMARRVGMLSTLAIEAADESYEDENE